MVALAALALTGSAGCGASCDISDEGNPPEIFAGGAVSDRGDYASSSSQGPLLWFPGGKQYQLVHHLGFTPLKPEVYFGFAQNENRVAPCAGNSCEIRCWDDQIIWVKNDTCTDFWIVVVANGKSPYPIARCDGDNVDAGAPATESGAPTTESDALTDAAIGAAADGTPE